MAVPQLALLVVQFGKGVAGDDVLDAGEAGRVGAGHVDGALDEVGGHEHAVVVGLQVVVGGAADEVEAVEEEHHVLRPDQAELLGERVAAGCRSGAGEQHAERGCGEERWGMHSDCRV